MWTFIMNSCFLWCNCTCSGLWMEASSMELQIRLACKIIYGFNHWLIQLLLPAEFLLSLLDFVTIQLQLLIILFSFTKRCKINSTKKINMKIKREIVQQSKIKKYLKKKRSKYLEMRKKYWKLNYRHNKIRLILIII